MHALKLVLALASLASLVAGHARMVVPRTLLSPESPGVPGDEIDYDIDNSLFLNGTNWPCKGYHHSRYAQTPSVTLQAGLEQDLVVTVGAHHNGGTCELSLSYDNGLTFRVFKRFIGGCPVANYQWTAKYKIPEYAPSGERVIFSWTWLALTGNIEMWQSCSIVKVVNEPQKVDAARFRRLPPVWRGALYEFNPLCVTEDTKHLFPPLTVDVEVETSADALGVVPRPEDYPYPLPDGLCDNDNRIPTSWAYDEMQGMNGADCNLPPMVPCTLTEGWPTRESYIQACTRHAPPVGWKQWPVRCGGEGPVDESGLPGDPDPGHGGHGKLSSSQKRKPGSSSNIDFIFLLETLLRLLKE